MIHPSKQRAFRRTVLGASALLVLAVCGCPKGAPARRYGRAEAQQTLRSLERPGVVIGEFRLASAGVVDGDTIRVEGIETSLRLLAIDTEEKLRTAEDKRLFDRGWEEFKRIKRGDSRKPLKIASPMGEEASEWAKAFFADVERVRLERDDPSEIRGSYGRYLTYVFADKDGRWLNYNVEAVRAGMSPYFMKYGHSRRFHRELEQAMAEARRAKRGIWDPRKQSYGDYDARLSWWRERAALIDAFRRDAGDGQDYVALGQWNALARLESHLGKEVEVLGAIGAVKLGDKGPTRVLLTRGRGATFALIFFDKDVFLSTGLLEREGEFIRARGRVSKYFNKYKKRDELQMIINLPGQVMTAPVPFFRRTAVNDNASVSPRDAEEAHAPTSSTDLR